MFIIVGEIYRGDLQESDRNWDEVPKDFWITSWKDWLNRFRKILLKYWFLDNLLCRLLTKEGVVTLMSPLSTKTFQNVWDVGILIYCSNVFLLLGKPSVLYYVILQIFMALDFSDFLDFRHLLRVSSRLGLST